MIRLFKNIKRFKLFLVFDFKVSLLVFTSFYKSRCRKVWTLRFCSRFAYMTQEMVRTVRWKLFVFAIDKVNNVCLVFCIFLSFQWCNTKNLILRYFAPFQNSAVRTFRRLPLVFCKERHSECKDTLLLLIYSKIGCRNSRCFGAFFRWISVL